MDIESRLRNERRKNEILKKKNEELKRETKNEEYFLNNYYFYYVYTQSPENIKSFLDSPVMNYKLFSNLVNTDGHLNSPETFLNFYGERYPEYLEIILNHRLMKELIKKNGYAAKYIRYLGFNKLFDLVLSLYKKNSKYFTTVMNCDIFKPGNIFYVQRTLLEKVLQQKQGAKYPDLLFNNNIFNSYVINSDFFAQNGNFYLSKENNITNIFIIYCDDNILKKITGTDEKFQELKLRREEVLNSSNIINKFMEKVYFKPDSYYYKRQMKKLTTL